MRCFPAFLLLLLLSACETDSYETGEGQYSLLQADFAELTANSEKQGVSFVTDDGTRYQLEKPVAASWIKTADSVYRTAIYYNKVREGVARSRSVTLMPTLIPRDVNTFKRQPQDPLGVESCWVTKNGKYLNMGLLMKNGRDETGHEGTHALSLALDEVHQNADMTHTAYYRLLHDQGGTPEYYTNRRYVCILLPDKNRPDSVRLTVNTYEGTMVKTLKLD